MELNLMTIWQYKENDERKSKIWAFLVEKKETVDEGKVRVLSDLFCVSCALADTADWGQICFAFNENVTVGLFIGESNGAERLNAVLNNHSRDFPCSYDDLQWYFKAMDQVMDSRYDFKKEIYNLIPGLSRNMEKEYYNAVRAYLKENLSAKAYSRIEFEERDNLILFRSNV